MTRLNFTGGILIAFALGIAGMWAYEGHHLPQLRSVVAAPPAPHPNVLGNNLFQPGIDPFKEMARMQKQMDQFFNQKSFFGNGIVNQGIGGAFGRGGTSRDFGSWFRGSSTDPGSSIETGEDDKSVFYTVRLGDKNVSRVKVNVDHGYISIDATLQDKTSNSLSTSSLSERFPVPQGVDPNSANISRKGDSIVIRFNKLA